MIKKLISLMIVTSMAASASAVFAEADLASEQATASQTQTETQTEEQPEAQTYSDYMHESFGEPVEEQEVELAEKTIQATEDFSKGMTNWKVVSGTGYGIKNGALQFKNSRTSQKTSLILSKEILVDNADIEFDVKYKNGVYFGVVFRADSDQSMYVLRFYKQTGKANLLKKVKGGDLVMVKSVDARLKSDEYSRVGIRLAGRKIQIRLNNEHIMNVEDASLQTGYIGFDAYNSEAYVDNIEVFRFDGVEYDIEYPTETKEKRTIYVAAEGEDGGDGSYDRPIIGVEKAVEVARLAKRGGFPVDVIFKEGSYYFEKTVSLGPVDSGTPKAPITYKAEEGKKVVFTGARKFDASRFKPVTDPKIVRRLHNNAKGKVLQLQFTDAEIPRNISNFTNDGQAHITQHLPSPIIYVNGKQQTLAQWPNGNYAFIEESTPGKDATSAGDTDSVGAIHFKNSEPLRWLEAVEEGHVYANGQFGVYWAGEAIPVDRIDVNENKLWLKYASLYTVAVDHRYYIMNLIEEIDIPGEYYIDSDRRILYLWPTEELTEDVNMEFATLETPMFSIVGGEYINFEGINFSKSANNAKNAQPNLSTSASAVYMDKVRDIHFNKCIVNNMGYHGIHMSSGYGLRVENCIIDNIGFSGIMIHTGGDRATLTPSEIVIRNNIFSAAHAYTDAMNMGELTTGAEGYVGTVEMEVSNNIFHNTKGVTMLYYGNGNIIKHNEFSSCVNASADCGAIYVGRSFVDHGNVVYQNYFHDIGMKFSKSGHPSIGIYWDDEITGQSAIQNIIVMNLYQNIANMHISGFDHTVTGNTLVNSDRGLIYSQRRAFPGYDYLTNSTTKHTWKWEWTGIPTTSDLFKDKYPKMASTMDRLMGEWGGFLHMESVVSNNLLVNIGKDSIHENAYTHSEMEGTVNFYYAKEPENKGNIKGCTNYYGNGEIDESINYEIFVDPDNHDWRVKDEAREKYNISDEILGEEFDMDTIGLQSDLTLPEGSEDFDLLFPTNGLTGIQTKDVTFAWTRADGADEYYIEVATDPEFKDVVYEESLIYRATYPTQLKNSTTYYWRVKAKNLSKQIGFENDSRSGVWSFTTAAQDDLDYGLLDSKISKANEMLQTIEEGEKMDQYQAGTKDLVRKYLKEAEEFKASGKGTQADVDLEVDKFNGFLLGLDSYINAGYITLDPEEAEFVEGIGPGTFEYLDDNVIRHVGGTASSGFYYDKVLSNSAVLAYKFRVVEGATGHVSFGLRCEKYSTYTYGQDSYYLYIKPDQIEMQRNGVIYRAFPNDGLFHFDGQWNEMEFAAITTATGAHCYWKCNGKIVVDYLETVPPKVNPGAFGIFTSKGMTVEVAPVEKVPEGLFKRSDEVQIALDTGARTFDAFDKEFSTPSGEWAINNNLKSHNDGWVKSSKGGEAQWTIDLGRQTAGKTHKVYYYHNPSADGDKNVTIELANYFGYYRTNIDLSKGEKGWVEIGGMKLISASNSAEGTIKFIGSGNGNVNVSHIKVMPAEGERDLIGK